MECEEYEKPSMKVIMLLENDVICASTPDFPDFPDTPLDPNV